MKPAWSFRLRHTITAGLILLAGYFAYLAVVLPWLTPPVVTAMPLKAVAALRPTTSLEDLFPADAWQNQMCIRLRTADATLLFKEWKSKGDRQWTVSPVTIIYGRGIDSDPSGQPIILESIEGAEIEFADSVDLGGGTAPPISRGRLKGEVLVTRHQPAAASQSFASNRSTESSQLSATNVADGKNRSFSLKTTNIVIDKNRLYTTSPIEMQLGGASMRGRDLTLHLSHDQGKRKVVPDRMELIYLDEMRLPLEPTPSGQTQTVQIGCRGSVEYDFALTTLSMQDRVEIRRVLQNGPGKTLTDRFAADELQLRLREIHSRRGKREITDWIDTVTATGDPVVVDLPSVQSSVRADSLLWNVRRGHFQAGGRRGIELRRQSMVARLTKIDYEYPPENLQQIGVIVASGAGIVRFDDPSGTLKSWRWLDGLEIRPANDQSRKSTETVSTGGGAGQRMKIFVDGGCDFETHDGGSGHADKIFGECLQTDDGELIPRVLNIVGNVSIEDPRMGVRTEKMHVFFRPSVGPVQRAETIATSSPAGLVSQPRGRPALIVNGSNGVSANLASGDQRPKPPATPPPILRGEQIGIEVAVHQGEFSPTRLTIEGDLSLSTTMPSEGGRLPTVLRGERMVWDGQPGQDVLQLVGTIDKPARLDIGDGFLIGPEIQVRRLDNLIWMKDAGEFQVPSALVSGHRSGSGANGGSETSGRLQKTSAISWAEPPRCRWNGEMQFDGTKISIDGGVNATAVMLRDGEMQTIDLHGESLVASLRDQVDLMRLQSSGQTSIQSLALTGTPERSVFAGSRGLDSRQQMSSKHQFHARELTMQPTIDRGAIDTLVGSGPGWYRGWTSNDQATSTKPASASPMQLGGTKAVRGVHLAFRDSMVARMGARDMTFNGAVRVAMRDLDDFDSVLDGANLSPPPPGVSIVDCNSLRMSSPPADLSRSIGPTPDTLVEVQATGGVRFQTHVKDGLLTGDASMATYASANDLFVVRGMSGTPARVRVTRSDGQPGMNASIKILSIHPRQMIIDQFVPLNLQMPVPQTARRP